MIEAIPFTSTIISNGCQIFNWDHRNAKIIRHKKYHFCYMKLPGFHGNLCYNSKDRGVPTVNTHISAATHPRILYLLPN